MDLHKIFNNPYAKPLVNNSCKNPLQIWELDTNVNVEQTFFNVRKEDSDPVYLEEIQRKAYEQEGFRQQLKDKQAEEAEQLQEQELKQFRDDELGKQYTEFQSKMDKIPFLKQEQRKALEDQFVIDLMKENDILKDSTVPLNQLGIQMKDNLNTVMSEALGEAGSIRALIKETNKLTSAKQAEARALERIVKAKQTIDENAGTKRARSQ